MDSLNLKKSKQQNSPFRWQQSDLASYWHHYELAKEWIRIHNETSEFLRKKKVSDVGTGTTWQDMHQQQTTEASTSHETVADRTSSASHSQKDGAVVGEPNWTDKPKTTSIVGVVLSLQQDVVNFFVYSFESNNFTHQVPVERTKFPSTCNSGNWFRLLFSRDFDLDIYSFCPEAAPLRPRRVVNCNRRVTTRIWDGTVNFFVHATRVGRSSEKEEQISAKMKELQLQDTYLYNCRLGVLKLSREELLEEIGEEDGENGVTINNGGGGGEASVPERLKLWCRPNGWNKEPSKEKYHVTRIDARIWISSDGESEKENDEDMKQILEGSKLNKLQKSLPNLAVKKVPLSASFSGWFSGLIHLHYYSKRLTDQRRRAINIFVANLRDKLMKHPVVFYYTTEIAIFGSVDSGFGTNDSDLDLCLVNTGIDLRPSAEKIRRWWLTEIEKILQESGEYTLVSAVLDARTPIVKFEHLETGFHGDISVENKLAIYNTKLLRLYTEFDRRVAPLGFAIKRWAKLCGINDASAGSISSYAYIVMLIHFLQRTEPPVLPFLQNEYEGEEVEGWNVSFTKDIGSLKLDTTNTQSLADLFHDFLHYYAYVFNPSFEVAQIRTSAPYDRISRGEDCVRFRFCVEDPFDLSHNLTSGVREDTLHYILKCFRSALRGLEHFDQQHFSGGKVNGEIPLKMDLDNFLRQFKARRVMHINNKAVPENGKLTKAADQ